MTAIIWDWRINKSIGIFIFDEKIDLNKVPFRFLKVNTASDLEPWDTYEIGEDKTRFSIDNDILISVECTYSFLFNSTNLIALKIDEVIKLLNSKYSVVDTWGFGRQINIDGLGLILWEEDSIIESITVSKGDNPNSN